jgi:zinc protease
MQKIREERGLNYGNYSYIEHFVQDGGTTFPLPNLLRQRQYFHIWIRPVAHENAHFALRAALRELERLAAGDVDRETLGGTRSFLVNYSKLWTQTLSRRLGYRMDSQFHGMENYIEEIEKRLPGIDTGSILEVARTHLGHGNMKIAMVTEDARYIKERLVSNEPSPINYGSDTTPGSVLDEDRLIENFPIRIDPGNIVTRAAQDLFED